jgi:hypothetical protein
LRFGTTTRERSGWTREVLNRQMMSTRPSTWMISTLSPMRYGFVKMIVSPATTLLRTP